MATIAQLKAALDGASHDAEQAASTIPGITASVREALALAAATTAGSRHERVAAGLRLLERASQEAAEAARHLHAAIDAAHSYRGSLG